MVGDNKEQNNKINIRKSKSCGTSTKSCCVCVCVQCAKCVVTPSVRCSPPPRLVTTMCSHTLPYRLFLKQPLRCCCCCRTSLSSLTKFQKTKCNRLAAARQHIKRFLCVLLLLLLSSVLVVCVLLLLLEQDQGWVRRGNRRSRRTSEEKQQRLLHVCVC